MQKPTLLPSPALARSGARRPVPQLAADPPALGLCLRRLRKHPSHAATAAASATGTVSLCRRGAVAVAALLVAACASVPTIRSERDQTVDFTSYRDFGFVEKPGTDRDGYASLVTRALKQSTRRQMEARGYRYVESGGELLVNFNANLADRVDITPKAQPKMHYYDYRGYVTWPGYDVVVDQYKEGTLNIDVVDARRRQLIWEGVAIGRVTDKTYRDRDAAIDRAVTAIFKSYPVPPKP